MNLTELSHPFHSDKEYTSFIFYGLDFSKYERILKMSKLLDIDANINTIKISDFSDIIYIVDFTNLIIYSRFHNEIGNIHKKFPLFDIKLIETPYYNFYFFNPKHLKKLNNIQEKYLIKNWTKTIIDYNNKIYKNKDKEYNILKNKLKNEK